jgi:hypothetical protein
VTSHISECFCYTALPAALHCHTHGNIVQRATCMQTLHSESFTAPLTHSHIPHNQARAAAVTPNMMRLLFISHGLASTVPHILFFSHTQAANSPQIRRQFCSRTTHSHSAHINPLKIPHHIPDMCLFPHCRQASVRLWHLTYSETSRRRTRIRNCHPSAVAVAVGSKAAQQC